MKGHISIKELMSGKINLDYDHLLQRLQAKGTDEKYIKALKQFAQIPGFTISDHYRSFYELLCTYNELQTRTQTIETYLDESIEIVTNILTENQKKDQWKRTQPQL